MLAQAPSMKVGGAGTWPPAVVVLTPWFPNTPQDHYAAFVYESAAALKRAGATVVVVVCRPLFPRFLDRFAPEWARGEVDTKAFSAALDHVEIVRHVRLPYGFLRSLSNLAQRRTVTGALVAVAREVRASLIHAHTEGMAPIALTAADKLGIPVVATIHGQNMDSRYLHAPRQKRLLAPALKKVDRLVLVGDPLKAFFGAYAGRDDHIRVVPNGVRLPAGSRVRPLFQSPPLRLVSVANLVEGKGIDVALDALALLDSAGAQDWTYSVIGDGYERASLQDRTRSLGIADRVTFLGTRPPAFVFDCLQQSDVFVLPSYREAFGIAYLEAMACGMPAIGIEGQGPEAFIEHRRSGFLVAPKSARAVADCLLAIRARPDEAREIGLRAASSAKNFTWDAHASRLLEVYRETLACRNA